MADDQGGMSDCQREKKIAHYMNNEKRADYHTVNK